MIVIRNVATDEVTIVASLDGVDMAAWEETGQESPTDLETQAYGWNGASLVPLRRLSGPQILFLHTIPERAAARRMATAVYPVGHPLGGQLIDPDGNVQVLFDTLLAFPGALTLDDTFFLQGNALLLGLGILTPERAARIRAGLPPEVA